MYTLRICVGESIKQLHLKAKKAIQSKLKDEKRKQYLCNLYSNELILVGSRGKEKPHDTPGKRKLRHALAEKGKIEESITSVV